MAAFESLSDLRNFIQAPPQHNVDQDSYRRALADWLAGASFDLQAFEPHVAGDSFTLIVMAEDAAFDFTAYAVPDNEIQDWLRKGLESIDGRCFEQHFTADLAEEQWLGALWFLSLTFAQNEDDIEDLFEGPLEEMEESGVAFDLDELKAQAGAWEKYAIKNGGGLNHPISHCHTVNLAM